jgi:uncharacterized protein (DUF1778 family)
MARPQSKGEDESLMAEAAPGGAPASREARLEIRLTREQKALVVRAAAAQGASVAEFVRRAVQDSAVQTVTEHEVLRLCAQDQQAFAHALLSSREPSERLKAARDLYRERVGA